MTTGLSGWVGRFDAFSFRVTLVAVNGTAEIGLCASLRRCMITAPARPLASHHPQPGSGMGVDFPATPPELKDGLATSSIVGGAGIGAGAGRDERPWIEFDGDGAGGVTTWAGAVSG